MNKLLFALSLAKKSGKLVVGFDAVKTAVIHGNAHIVLLANDLSEKTIKRKIKSQLQKLRTQYFTLHNM